MIAQNRQGGAIMDNICDAILNGLFIFLSAAVVFLPLIVIVPSWLRLSPFYRRAMQATNRIFESPEELDLLLPGQTEKHNVMASIIKKGDKGV